MKFKLFIILAAGLLPACASVRIAENVKLISFTDKPNAKENKSLGTIEGSDCTWYVGGYALGRNPTVLTAFQNTASQTEEKFPLKMTKKEGATGNLAYLRNVSVNPSGFSAWLVGKTCMNVTGVAYQ